MVLYYYLFYVKLISYSLPPKVTQSNLVLPLFLIGLDFQVPHPLGHPEQIMFVDSYVDEQDLAVQPVTEENCLSRYFLFITIV